MGGDLFWMADRQLFEQLNIFSEQITLAVRMAEYFLEPVITAPTLLVPLINGKQTALTVRTDSSIVFAWQVTSHMLGFSFRIFILPCVWRDQIPDNDLKHFSTLYLFPLHKLATKNLHLATIFLRLVAKKRLKEFFNFEPWNNYTG